MRLDENLLRFYLLRLLKRNYFASVAFILTSVVSVAFILTSGAFILTSVASVAFILTSIVSVACAYFDVYCVFCCVDDVYCVLTTRLLAAMTQKRSNIYWSNIYWISFASSIDANLL